MAIEAQESSLTKKQEVSYMTLIETDDFQMLVKQKKAFVLPMSIFFLVFYFVLPVLAAYTKILNNLVIGPITWAWVYALSQFALVWIGGFVYMKKSRNYDRLASNILTKYKEELR